MKPLISFVSLVCSILVLLGVFLPWLRSGGGFFSSSTAGWDLTNFEIGTFSLWPGWYGSTDGVVQSFPEPQVMLAGGIMMFFCAFASCAITMYSRKEEGLLHALGTGFTLGAVTATVAAVWFFIRAASLGEAMESFRMSFGFYLCAVCAFLGLALGIATIVRTYRALRDEPEIAPSGSIPVALGVLAAGTLAFMGTFLPWFKTTMLNVSIIVNGWTLDTFNAEPAMEPYFAQIYVVLAGSVILGTFGMLSYVISKTATMGKGFYPFSSGAALFGALLTAFGALWFFLQVGGRMEAITFGAGPFISLLAAIAWLCVGPLPLRSLEAVAVQADELIDRAKQNIEGLSG